MASQRPTDSRPTFRHRIQGIKLQPPKSKYDIGGEIDADGTRVHKLKRIGKGKTLEWKDLYASCDVHDGSWITVQVKEGHTLTKDRLGYAKYQVSQSNAMDSFAIETESNDGGKPMFKVHIQVMGNESIEQAYSEALEHAKMLQRKQGSRIKARKIGEVFEKTSALSNIMLDLDPTGGAKAAVWVCVKAWENLQSQEKEDEMLEDLLEDLSITIPTIESVRSIAETNLKETVMDMLRLIEDVLVFVLGTQPNNRLERARSSFLSSGTQRQVDMLVKRSERLRREFNERIGAQNLRSSELYRRRERLKELRPVELASYNTSRQCLDGTRVRIIDTLVAWAQGSNEPVRLAWVHGLAGLGKSSIMTSVCKQLDDIGALVCSFFCKQDSPDLRDPRRVLMTIVCELAQRWDAYGSAVAHVICKNIALHSKHIQQLYDILVTEPWRSVSQAELPKQTFAVIIDALDECEDAITRRQLLMCLRDISRLAPFLRIIVTSRPHEDIRRYFRNANPGWYTEFDLLQYDASTDIRLFVQQQFEPLNSVRGWPTNAVDLVATRANGLFIWAGTACAYVLTGLNKLRRLLLLTEGSPLGAIDNLYKTILTAQETIGDEEDMNEVRSCLGTIVVTSMRSALSVHSLVALMGEHASSEVLQGVVDRLAAVLYTDKSLDGAIRLSHPSFMEFIVDRNRSNELCIDLAEQNRIIAERCLKVMMSELRFNICGLETSDTLNRNIPDLNVRVQRTISTQLSYACLYWTSHLVEAHPHTLAPLVRDFMSKPQLLYWIEVLSLLGRLSAAPTSLMQVVKWCNNHSIKDSSAIANDTYRFVLTFYDTISASTPHLYISALAFAPTESHIYRRMSKQFPNLLEVAQGGEADWPTCIRSISVSSAVRAVAISPDGEWIVSGCEDGKVYIWNLATGEAVCAALEGHSRCVTCITFSPDGRQIVSGSEDCTLRIWDAQNGEMVLGPLNGHLSPITCVAYSPNSHLIASGSARSEATIRIWNARNGNLIKEPLKHDDSVRCLCFSPDSRQLASGSDDCIMRIWDPDTHKTILNSEKSPHEGYVTSVSYSSCGRRIVSGTDEHQLRMWSSETGEEIKSMMASEAPESIAFVPSGEFLCLSSRENSIFARTVDTGAMVLGPLAGHTGKIRSMVFSPNGDYIVSGSNDKTVRIWSTISSTEIKVVYPTNGDPYGRLNEVKCIAISSDGSIVISGHKDRTVRIWDTETGRAMLAPLDGVSHGIRLVAFSPDDTAIFCVSEGGTIHKWDAKSGERLLEPLQTNFTTIFDIVVSSNGHAIAVGRRESGICAWNSSTGETATYPFDSIMDSVEQVRFLPSRQRLIVAGYYLSQVICLVCDMETGGTASATMKSHSGYNVTRVTLSYDGRRAASGSRDHTVTVWDIETGKKVFDPLTGHSGPVSEVVFSSDDRHLISGSFDQTIRVWDMATGAALLCPLLGQPGLTVFIKISSDGRRIASGAFDGIRIWDLEPFTTPTAAVSYVSADTRIPTLKSSSNNKRLVSAAQLLNNLDPDSPGWVIAGDGRLVVWLPPEMRKIDSSLVHMSRHGVRHRTVIDFTRFVHGESWTSVVGADSRSKVISANVKV
ncbi:hypothetical protein RhiJN_28952 [Ceratobasidium sp. AG-Ba]|nr:hypothetical protein RhiJN_28952 [Ceratobasidium sp. AG-Ba]